ncbi:MAG: MOSC N-terminal beta barrel domain-containing protein [Verrucomicrobiota bacterium]
MKQIGTIQQLWRYPLKGVAGEQVKSSKIGPFGIEGDRLWAVFDQARQEVQSCKFRPELLQCQASFQATPQEEIIEIRFPDGATISSKDPGVHQKLSQLIGHESRLIYLKDIEQVEASFYRYRSNGNDWLNELKETFTREPGEPLPDFLQSPENIPESSAAFITIPGTFFLVAPLHIVTTATMKHMKLLHPKADWDIRRFRPNLVIETHELQPSLLEQEWVGRKILIGNARVDCTETAVRCGAVTRPLEELPRDPSMLRSIVKDADQNLGIYGHMSDTASIKVGDPVYLQ